MHSDHRETRPQLSAGVRVRETGPAQYRSLVDSRERGGLKTTHAKPTVGTAPAVSSLELAPKISQLGHCNRKSPLSGTSALKALNP